MRFRHVFTFVEVAGIFDAVLGELESWSATLAPLPKVTTWHELGVNELLSHAPLPSVISLQTNVALSLEFFVGCAGQYLNLISSVAHRLAYKDYGGRNQTKYIVPMFPVGRTSGPLSSEAFCEGGKETCVKHIEIDTRQFSSSTCGTAWVQDLDESERPQIGIRILDNGESSSTPNGRLQDVTTVNWFSDEDRCLTSRAACSGDSAHHDDILVYLRWYMRDVRPAFALPFARRSGCFSELLKWLPELSALTIAFGSDAALDWERVSNHAQICIELHEGSFWEIHATVQDQLPEVVALLADHYQLPVVGQITSVLTFVCTPSRQGRGRVRGMWPNSHCDAQAITSHVVPFMLAHKLKQKDGYTLLRRLRGPFNAFGGAFEDEAIHNQMRSYHIKAVMTTEQQATQHMSRTEKTPAPLTVAMCITGLLRTFSLPKVYKSIAANGTHLGRGVKVSFFYVVDSQGRSMDEFADAFKWLPPAHSKLDSKDFAHMSPWPNTIKSCHVQFRRLSACVDLIADRERDRGYAFDWVIRTRPDLRLMAPVGLIERFDPSLIYAHVRRDTEKMLGDNFFILHRSHAEALFGMKKENHTQFQICERILYDFAKRLNLGIGHLPEIFDIVRPETCLARDEQCSNGWKHVLPYR